jgi:limonene-1,2-epoxide hydrolase
MATDPDALVKEFCAAWERMDPDELASYFTDDGVYHNIPMAPMEGRDAIREGLAGMKAMISSIRFEIHRQIASGDVVMNERTDHLKMGESVIALPVVGVFELSDGKIRAWRDYFDMGQFTGATG